MSEFSTHADYMAKVADIAEARSVEMEKALELAFKSASRQEMKTVVDFSSLDAKTLGEIFEKHPKIVKTVLYACNVAGRAIKRDLKFKNFDTYKPRFEEGQAVALAAYLKPFLPESITAESLAYFDRIAYIDKEIRKGKGGWEKMICEAAEEHGAPRKFKKCKFTHGKHKFELDVACKVGDVIEVGVDVKRCEAIQDLHKRTDEIVNKASHFKDMFPTGKFGVVVYFPFPEQQSEFKDRAGNTHIDGLVFANDDEDVVSEQVRALFELMGIAAPTE